MSGWFTSFLNCRLCVGGKLVQDQLVVSDDTGLILPRTGYIGGDAVDLEEAIIAPGLLELHTNGLLGFHFTHFHDEKDYAAQIDNAAKFLVTQGVTGFWATIPTVSSDEYKKVDARFPSPSLDDRCTKWCSINQKESCFHRRAMLPGGQRQDGHDH
jgi:N-acetylglucosamine-6-phosphate deacetylase